ncbi:hypothetical protein CEXT_696671 [Caerostris extrusa]|uniref:Uncharacterized protein n=1 Tax=Caerostris extrusa TaxID=172846 RepID=A0AAV4N2G9_CAEEX|nr:hypothetical protein CEXT_696671 [Caerostris extrusa]
MGHHAKHLCAVVPDFSTLLTLFNIAQLKGGTSFHTFTPSSLPQKQLINSPVIQWTGWRTPQKRGEEKKSPFFWIGRVLGNTPLPPPILKGVVVGFVYSLLGRFQKEHGISFGKGDKAWMENSGDRSGSCFHYCGFCKEEKLWIKETKKILEDGEREKKTYRGWGRDEGVSCQSIYRQNKQKIGVNPRNKRMDESET